MPRKFDGFCDQYVAHVLRCFRKPTSSNISLTMINGTNANARGRTAVVILYIEVHKLARSSIPNDRLTWNSRTTSRNDADYTHRAYFSPKQRELSAIATTSALSPHAIPSWRADLGLMWTSLCEASVRQVLQSMPFMPFRASTVPL
jgi:hypothetical protein